MAPPKAEKKPFDLASLSFLGLAVTPMLVLAVQNLLWGVAITTQDDRGRIDILVQLYQRHAEKAVVLADGRLEWLTLLLGGLVIVPTCLFVSGRIVQRNLRGAGFVWIVSAWLLASIGLALLPWWNSQSEMLVMIYKLTEKVALRSYGSDFATFALTSTGWLFLWVAATSAGMALAAASVLRRVSGEAETAETLKVKRDDIKTLLILASLLLTFATTLMGSWLRWPASFIATAAKTAKGMDATALTHAADQVRAFAESARLYFGAGYSLALAVVAIPAIVLLSRRLPAEPGEDSTPFLFQNILKPQEVTIVLSMIAPLLAGAIGVILKV